MLSDTKIKETDEKLKTTKNQFLKFDSNPLRKDVFQPQNGILQMLKKFFQKLIK